MPLLLRSLFALVLFSALGLVGCDETGPTPASNDRVVIDAQQLPDGTFVLKDFVVGPPGRPVRLMLLGKALQVDPATDRVSLDVSVANQSDQVLHPGLLVWLSTFNPSDVTVDNADVIPPSLPGAEPGPWGFDYSELLGEDGVLSPGEVTGSKPWIFHSPGLGAFSFAADFEVNVVEPGAHISGHVFADVDADGERDPNEPPFGGGWIMVAGPREFHHVTMTDDDGAWAVRVELPGLYTVSYEPPPTVGFVPVEITTPNPLEVLLSLDENGTVQSFEEANFGVANTIPAVRLTDLPPGEIQQDPYTLIDVGIRGNFLRVKIGFGGCEPDHPFDVFLSGGLSDANVAQGLLVARHDNRDELCDAWFEEERAYSLLAVIAKAREVYGEHATVVLNFMDFEGDLHPVVLEY